MPVVTKDQALELLTHEVREKFGADEVREVHNEVFPGGPYAEGEEPEDVAPLIEQLVDRINNVEIGEVIDLWGLIFPRHRNIWYDEEEERLHYNEGDEAVSSE